MIQSKPSGRDLDHPLLGVGLIDPPLFCFFENYIIHKSFTALAVGGGGGGGKRHPFFGANLPNSHARSFFQSWIHPTLFTLAATYKLSDQGCQMRSLLGIDCAVVNYRFPKNRHQSSLDVTF